MERKNSEFMLWIVICTIIGLFIWQMPNIERLIFGRAKKDKTKTEEKAEEKKDEIVKSGRITCGMTGNNEETVEYQISYTDSKLTKVTEIISAVYETNSDEYKKALEICNNTESKYANHDGFTATCTNDYSVFETKRIYDLKKFKEFTIDNNNETEIVSIDVRYNEDIDSVIKKYQEKGATCK